MKKKKYHELTELKKLLKRKNYSYRKFAKIISMSTDAFNNKINGYTYFNTDEVDKIVHALAIDKNDIGIYFFPGCCVTQQISDENFYLDGFFQRKII